MPEKGRITSFEAFDLGALLRESEAQEKRPRSKREIVELLLVEGDRWCRWVEEFPVERLTEEVRMHGGIFKNRFELLLGTKEHELQHRAQLTVIVRLLGIVPHLTRNRQPRREVSAQT